MISVIGSVDSQIKKYFILKDGFGMRYRSSKAEYHLVERKKIRDGCLTVIMSARYVNYYGYIHIQSNKTVPLSKYKKMYIEMREGSNNVTSRIRCNGKLLFEFGDIDKEVLKQVDISEIKTDGLLDIISSSNLKNDDTSFFTRYFNIWLE